MKIKEKCKRCKSVNVLEKEKLNIVFVKDENGKEYRVIYYVCGGCKKPVLVQIDDDVTLRILRSLVDLTMRAIEKREANESVSRQWEKKKDALNLSLTSKRERLKKVMKGKEVVNKDKNIRIIV